MQVSTTLLIVAAEVYVLLLVGMLVLFLYSRKQKKLVERQQKKLLDLIKEVRTVSSAPTPSAPAPAQTTAEKGYKFHINQQLETTQKRFSQVIPNGDIAAAQASDGSAEQRILALRYAFLRSEELGTTEDPGSDKYWSIFQQTLEPLLQSSPNSSLIEEIQTYKKRVENLEKFKKLFFDLEAQWNAAQNTSENYHAQLLALSDQVLDPNAYQLLLQSYQGTFGDFSQSMKNTSNAASDPEGRTINIIRQDPRAAEEIIKLRNVAADQYRVINNLQRKLEEATSDEQKAMIIRELEQQLQRQIRFVQESDACVQLLEDELIKANEKIAEQEQLIDGGQKVGEENANIKDTLHSFTLESRDLLANLESLEQENMELKEQLESLSSMTDSIAKPTISGPDQEALAHLQKQYAELEERYLALKMK
jgi:hypothetical protein